MWSIFEKEGHVHFRARGLHENLVSLMLNKNIFSPFWTRFLLITYFQDPELQETFGFNAHLVAAAVVSVDFN